VKSRQTSYFWKISRALKYMLKGVITCAPAAFVGLHAERPEQAAALESEPALPGHRQAGPGGAHLERASCCGQEAQRDVRARDQRQLQRSASQSARPCKVFAIAHATSSQAEVCNAPACTSPPVTAPRHAQLSTRPHPASA